MSQTNIGKVFIVQSIFDVHCYILNLTDFNSSFLIPMFHLVDSSGDFPQELGGGNASQEPTGSTLQSASAKVRSSF